MKLFRKLYSKQAFSVYLLLAIFTFIALIISIGALHPDMADDYCVYLVRAKIPGLFERFHYYYFGWTGRMQSVLVTWLGMMNPSTVVFFGGLNPAIFSLTAFIALYSGVGPKNKQSFPLVLAFVSVLATLWYFLPALNETVFWRSGSTAYLWPCFFFLLFVLPYLHFIQSPKEQTKISKLIVALLGFFIFGFWVGLGHEQLIFPTAFLTLVWLILVHKRLGLRKVPISYYGGITGFFAASVVLIIAPGNYMRLGQCVPGTGRTKLVESYHFLRDTFINNGHFGVTLGVTLVTILLVYMAQRRFQDECQEHHPSPSVVGFFIWLLTAAACFFPLMLFVPAHVFVSRTFFFSSIFLVVAYSSLISSFADLLFVFANSRKAKISLILVCGVLIQNALLNLNNTLSLRYQDKLRVAIFTEAKKKQLPVVEIPMFRFTPSRACLVSDMTDDPKNWLNVTYANYFQVPSVILSHTKYLQ